MVSQATVNETGFFFPRQCYSESSLALCIFRRKIYFLIYQLFLFLIKSKVIFFLEKASIEENQPFGAKCERWHWRSGLSSVGSNALKDDIHWHWSNQSFKGWTEVKIFCKVYFNNKSITLRESQFGVKKPNHIKAVRLVSWFHLLSESKA